MAEVGDITRLACLMEKHMKVTDDMVNRFLTWRLPDDFIPDAGISFGRTKYEWNKSQEWPTGTNLLTATQARQMLEHVLKEQVLQRTEER